MSEGCGGAVCINIIMTLLGTMPGSGYEQYVNCSRLYSWHYPRHYYYQQAR